MNFFERLTRILSDTVFFQKYMKFWPEPLNDASFDVFMVIVFAVMVIIPEIYYKVTEYFTYRKIKAKNEEYAKAAKRSELMGKPVGDMDLIEQYLKFLVVANFIDKRLDISFEEWKEAKFGKKMDEKSSEVPKAGSKFWMLKGGTIRKMINLLLPKRPHRVGTEPDRKREKRAKAQIETTIKEKRECKDIKAHISEVEVLAEEASKVGKGATDGNKSVAVAVDAGKEAVIEGKETVDVSKEKVDAGKETANTGIEAEKVDCNKEASENLFLKADYKESDVDEFDMILSSIKQRRMEKESFREKVLMMKESQGKQMESIEPFSKDEAYMESQGKGDSVQDKRIFDAKNAAIRLKEKEEQRQLRRKEKLDKQVMKKEGANSYDNGDNKGSYSCGIGDSVGADFT